MQKRRSCFLHRSWSTETGKPGNFPKRLDQRLDPIYSHNQVESALAPLREFSGSGWGGQVGEGRLLSVSKSGSGRANRANRVNRANRSNRSNRANRANRANRGIFTKRPLPIRKASRRGRGGVFDLAPGVGWVKDLVRTNPGDLRIKIGIGIDSCSV